MGDDYKTREALRLAPQSWGAPKVQHKKVAPKAAAFHHRVDGSVVPVSAPHGSVANLDLITTTAGGGLLAVAPQQAGAPGSAVDSAAPSTQIAPANPDSAPVSWGHDCPAGQLGVNTRESGLAPWKPEEWDDSNRIVQDVPITVGVPGTPSFRVIHGSRDQVPSDHGLPSSMITGRNPSHHCLHRSFTAALSRWPHRALRP